MLTIGIVYMVATLVADIAFSLLNPADPAEGGRMSVIDVPVEAAGALEAGRSEARGEVLRELVRSPTFIVGA